MPHSIKVKAQATDSAMTTNGNAIFRPKGSDEINAAWMSANAGGVSASKSVTRGTIQGHRLFISAKPHSRPAKEPGAATGGEINAARRGQ